MRQFKTALPVALNRLRPEQHWIWQDIVMPFVITRFILVLTGWFSQYFPPNIEYPIKAAIDRGWHFSPYRILDMWGRWDTGWYLDIVRNGYTMRGSFQDASNIAFFPLYPYTVRLLVYLIPLEFHTQGLVLLIGVVVSNVFLLGSLILLHKLVVFSFHDETIARRTILYLLLFPTAFFFSCFYTESTFLFMSVAAFYAATRRNWVLSSIFGGLLALTRPLGVIIAIPLVWMYLESVDWQLRRIQWKAVSFFLIPTCFLTFLLSIYHITGNLFAPIQIQSAWGRVLAMPWVTLMNPKFFVSYVTPIEQILTIAFLFLGLMSKRLLHSMSYSIYSFLLMLPPLFSGMLMANARYLVVIFPIFIIMAFLGKRQVIDQLFTFVFLGLQVLFMVAWSQFYWVG